MRSAGVKRNPQAPLQRPWLLAPEDAASRQCPPTLAVYHEFNHSGPTMLAGGNRWTKRHLISEPQHGRRAVVRKPTDSSSYATVTAGGVWIWSAHGAPLDFKAARRVCRRWSSSG